MLAFSNDYYGMIFRATQSVELFCAYIKKDITAVKNGIIYSYNNGLAEGSVNKIKVIKRVMYGRNSFELLKAKVLFGELFHVKFN